MRGISESALGRPFSYQLLANCIQTLKALLDDNNALL
jgi:hypothetical protein